MAGQAIVDINYLFYLLKNLFVRFSAGVAVSFSADGDVLVELVLRSGLYTLGCKTGAKPLVICCSLQPVISSFYFFAVRTDDNNNSY